MTKGFGYDQIICVSLPERRNKEADKTSLDSVVFVAKNVLYLNQDKTILFWTTFV